MVTGTKELQSEKSTTQEIHTVTYTKQPQPKRFKIKSPVLTNQSLKASQVHTPVTKPPQPETPQNQPALSTTPTPSPTLFALVADIALQVVQLNLQLVVNALGPRALPPVDDEDEDDDEEQEAPTSSDARDSLHGEAEGFRHIILHAPHLVLHVIHFDLQHEYTYVKVLSVT